MKSSDEVRITGERAQHRRDTTHALLNSRSNTAWYETAHTASVPRRN